MSAESAPDEILLMIFGCFPYRLPILLRLVCSRWNILLKGHRKNSNMDVSVMLGARFGTECPMFQWLCSVDCTITLNMLGTILQKSDTETLQSFKRRGIISTESYARVIGGYAEPGLLRIEMAINVTDEGFKYMLQGAVRTHRKHSIRLLFKYKRKTVRISPAKFAHDLLDAMSGISYHETFFKWCMREFGKYVRSMDRIEKIITWDMCDLLADELDDINNEQFYEIASAMIEHNRAYMLSMLLNRTNGEYSSCPDGFDCCDDNSICLYRRAVSLNRAKVLKKLTPDDDVRIYCVGAIEAAITIGNSPLLCWLLEKGFPISGDAIVLAKEKGGMVLDILQSCLDENKENAYGVMYVS